MDPIRIGSDVRLLRAQRGWSQARLAMEAKVSRWAVSQIELGRGDRIRLSIVGAVVAALHGYLSVRILYRGEGLDRLRDRRHAALVEAVVARLEAEDWSVATEVTFNKFGERGSIDILAFHQATRTLLVLEVKSVVPDVGGMMATLDRKVRLAREIAAERGWVAVRVARLLVLPETSSARRRVTEHQATFAHAFPARNVELNAWLRAPTTALAGLLFLSSARGGSHGRIGDELVRAADLGESSSPAHRDDPMTRNLPSLAGWTIK